MAEVVVTVPIHVEDLGPKQSPRTDVVRAAQLADPPTGTVPMPSPNGERVG